MSHSLDEKGKRDLKVATGLHFCFVFKLIWGTDWVRHELGFRLKGRCLKRVRVKAEELKEFDYGNKVSEETGGDEGFQRIQGTGLTWRRMDCSSSETGNKKVRTDEAISHLVSRVDKIF